MCSSDLASPPRAYALAATSVSGPSQLLAQPPAGRTGPAYSSRTPPGPPHRTGPARPPALCTPRAHRVAGSAQARDPPFPLTPARSLAPSFTFRPLGRRHADHGGSRERGNHGNRITFSAKPGPTLLAWFATHIPDYSAPSQRSRLPAFAGHSCKPPGAEEFAPREAQIGRAHV